MNSIDLTPFYRNSVGFDRLTTLLDSVRNADAVNSNYPPYNIEQLEENHYAITLAVAGFQREELEITVEKGVLSIRGEKANSAERKYLYQGIATRNFERRFNLAEYVEVKDASLNDGLLTIALVKEIPEAMKPRTITISQEADAIEHQAEETVPETASEAA